MEGADIGRGRLRRQGGRSNKPPLVRTRGAVNLGGLILFGGALAVGSLAAFIFKKSKVTDDDKKSTSPTVDELEQKQQQQQQQPTSNDASTLEGNQAEAAVPLIENCHLAADETQEEIDITPVHPDGDDPASSSDESSSPEDVEAMMEPDGGAEATKLNANEEIPAGYNDERAEEDDSDNRENRGENGYPDARCSPEDGRANESDDISNGASRKDLEEGEAFDKEITEMEALEEKDKGSLAGETMRMPATESNPKEDKLGEQELPSIKDANDGEGEEVKEKGTLAVEMNTQKTEDGVIEEVDGYVEDDDVDDMASEEDDSRGSSNDEMEKDDLEMLMLEGTETCSTTTDSNTEAIIWPAETIESLAKALEDQLTHLANCSVSELS